MNVRPNFQEASVLAAQGLYQCIPVSTELYSDLYTPIEVLRKLKRVSRHCYMLESIEDNQKWGRYTFLGYDPKLELTCTDGRLTVKNGTSMVFETKHPGEYIRQIVKENKSPRIERLPTFTGGLVGYFSYDYMKYAEPAMKLTAKDEEGFKDVDLMLFDKVIAYDHLKQKIVLIVNMKTDSVMENYGKACAALEGMAALINDQTPLPPLKATGRPSFTCNVTEAQYADIVEKTREYIFDGDIFQAVQSRQFSSPYQDSLLSAYRVLRTTNPSPYMVFLSIDGDEIMCSSPETLVRLDNGRLTTFPVAGSRPRGKTPEEDKALENELLADEKELSEHNMLVDLGRNDLGRVSKIGTVEVTDYMMIHRYSKIMHICSQVEGDIDEKYDACDAIEAVLPAGTLSGAPKIRACEIIEEQESEPRGVYGGALGYLDFTGNMDTCIAIRMAAKKNGIVTVQAGGGIVADSVPHNEYMESANKAKAVMNAIERASEVDG